MIGQSLVNRIESFIKRYVVFPEGLEGQSLLCALWVIHTWLYDRFPATPYLTITAATKQAGKTVLLETLSALVRQGQLLATLRPLAMVRLIETLNGEATLMIDEAEKLEQAGAGDLRSIMTTGYAAGGRHLISVGKESMSFRTHCPKAFALIGDVMDVVRDRAILVWLKRSAVNPDRDFRAERSAALSDGRDLQFEIQAWLRSVGDVPLVAPSEMTGRDREIWTAIYSTAAALKLNPETMDRLARVSGDLVSLKSDDARRGYFNKAAEDRAAFDAASIKALRDLLAVIGQDKAVFSAVAVERMKAIPASPWRFFKGEGLDSLKLAQLLKVFGVKSKTVRPGSGRGSQTGMGYDAAMVRAAAERAGVL